MQKSSKRLNSVKSLTKLSKKTERLQMTKMNNLLYVAALVKELQKILRGKPSLDRSKTGLNRREISLRNGCPFGAAEKSLQKNTASPLQPLLLLLA